MSTEDALIKLGESDGRGGPPACWRCSPRARSSSAAWPLVPGDANPLEGLPVPAVATAVSYVDGVTGGNVLVLPLEGARLLAAAMMGMEQPEEPEHAALSELELSAVAEAANQMMAGDRGLDVPRCWARRSRSAPPERARRVALREGRRPTRTPPTRVRISFTVCGEPCRLVQLVPNAFVVRMTPRARRARRRGPRPRR